MPKVKLMYFLFYSFIPRVILHLEGYYRVLYRVNGFDIYSTSKLCLKRIHPMQTFNPFAVNDNISFII